MSCAWALAKAAARVPMVSLERCMAAALRFKQIEADGAGFGALGADTVADRFFGILWHQRLQLRFGPLMIQKGLARAAKQSRKLGPRVRAAHVYNPDCLDPRLGRFNPKQARGLPALDTTPELP